MAVTSTPVSGRLRMTYPSGRADQSFGGIRPQLTPTNMQVLVQHLRVLQVENADQAFLSVEHELNETP